MLWDCVTAMHGAGDMEMPFLLTSRCYRGVGCPCLCKQDHSQLTDFIKGPLGVVLKAFLSLQGACLPACFPSIVPLLPAQPNDGTRTEAPLTLLLLCECTLMMIGRVWDDATVPYSKIRLIRDSGPSLTD